MPRPHPHPAPRLPWKPHLRVVTSSLRHASSAAQCGDVFRAFRRPTHTLGRWSITGKSPTLKPTLEGAHSVLTRSFVRSALHESFPRSCTDTPIGQRRDFHHSGRPSKWEGWGGAQTAHSSGSAVPRSPPRGPDCRHGGRATVDHTWIGGPGGAPEKPSQGGAVGFQPWQRQGLAHSRR